jgi:hypothetical protein
MLHGHCDLGSSILSSIVLGASLMFEVRGRPFNEDSHVYLQKSVPSTVESTIEPSKMEPPEMRTDSSGPTHLKCRVSFLRCQHRDSLFSFVIHDSRLHKSQAGGWSSCQPAETPVVRLASGPF